MSHFNKQWVPAPAAEHVVVQEIRKRVVDRLRNAGPVISAEHQAIVRSEVDSWVARRAQAGHVLPPVELETQLAAAVLAEMSGVGRLEPLLERPDVENIHIHGHDRVFLELSTGEIERHPYPVADSDADLIERLSAMFAQLGQTAREFSRANPIGNLHLPMGGPLGSRLAAVIEVSGRPNVAIRRYRLTDTTLEDLVREGTVDGLLVEVLRGAINAGCNIVVSGGPAAGKTTLLRTLCQEISPAEHLLTVEDERELGLELFAQHPMVTAWEARLPNAEGAGSITMDELLKQALRHSPHRVIVGEVRGGEVTSMLRALGNGAYGGMCTLHATSAHAVLDRIASLGTLADPPMPIEAAYRWTAAAVDLVVHARKRDTRQGRERFISEIVEIGQVGENGRPDTTTLFSPRPADGRAVPSYPPSPALLARLREHGVDPRIWSEFPDGTWQPGVLR
ncbi:CpaF family protein [Pseudonocardiaceae bacterium YIM PH 21723]|nr:CpaF family protein [Pseudonocardiaceae bacterium YIM PH 21723]